MNISGFIFLHRHCWYISSSNCRPWARQFHPFILNIKRKKKRVLPTSLLYCRLVHMFVSLLHAKHGTVPRHTINSPMSTLTARGDPELLWGIVSDLRFFRPDIIRTVILPFRSGLAERCGVRAVGGGWGGGGAGLVRSPTLSWLMTALATLTERDQRSDQQLLHNSTPARRQPPATLLCLAGTRDASKHVHTLRRDGFDLLRLKHYFSFTVWAGHVSSLMHSYKRTIIFYSGLNYSPTCASRLHILAFFCSKSAWGHLFWWT